MKNNKERISPPLGVGVVKITLKILLVLIGAFSTYRVYRESKLKNIKFDPLDANAFDAVFMVVGAFILLSHFIYLIITYLP